MRKYLLGLLLISFIGQITFAQTKKIFQSMEKANDLIEVGDELWMATEQGVVRMNKTTLERTIYTSQNSNLPANDIREIAINGQGQIMIGNYDVILALWDGNNWNNLGQVVFPDDLAIQLSTESHIYCMEFDQDDNLWIGSDNGISKFDGTSWEYFNLNNTNHPELQSIWDIEFDDIGNVYAGGPHLFKYDGNNWTNLSGNNQDLFSYTGVDLFKSDDGAIWYANLFSHYGKFVNDQWVSYNNTNTGDVPVGNSFIDLGNDTPALLSNIGIYNFENGIWEIITNDQFYNIENTQKQLYHIDTEGNQWLFGDALFNKKMVNDITTGFISQVPMYSNNVNQISEDHLGNIHFLNGSKNFLKYNNEELSPVFPQFSPLNPISPFFKDYVFTENGAIWFCEDEGLSFFDGNNWEYFNLSNSNIGTDKLSRIAIDQNEEIWAIGNEGLVHYDGNTWNHFSTNNSILEHNQIGKIVVTESNSIILATAHANQITYEAEAEIYIIKNNVWKKFDHANSLLPETMTVSDMFVDENDLLWVATSFNGVFTYDGMEWYKIEALDYENPVLGITGKNGKIYCSIEHEGIAILENGTISFLTQNENELLSNQVYELKIDQENNLWMSHPSGVQLIALDEIPTNVNPDLKAKDLLQLKISPNPTTDYIAIEFDNLSSSPATLQIFNTQGQILKQYNYGKLDRGIQQFITNTHNLPNGVYFIQIQNDSQVGITKFCKK